jgi:hypothetical protein
MFAAAAAGGIPDSAISSYSKVLPSGRPNEAATAAYLREREQTGDLGQHGRFLLDASQLRAIATAVLNPLSLLHGPPGTGKTTTIGGLLFFLRKRYGYKGRILATAQSNVAVDNMLETAMSKCCIWDTAAAKALCQLLCMCWTGAAPSHPHCIHAPGG